MSDAEIRLKVAGIAGFYWNDESVWVPGGEYRYARIVNGRDILPEIIPDYPQSLGAAMVAAVMLGLFKEKHHDFIWSGDKQAYAVVDQYWVGDSSMYEYFHESPAVAICLAIIGEYGNE